MKILYSFKGLLLIGAVSVGAFMLYKKRKEKNLKTWNPIKVFGKSTVDATVVGDLEE